MPEHGWRTSMLPVVWTTVGIFFAGRDQVIFCCDWWPWMKPGYTTKKIPSAKIRWENYHLDFLWSRWHWLSSKGQNYPCGVLLISVRAVEEHSEGNMLQGVHQVGLCPSSPGTCIPEETGLPGLLMSTFLTIFSRSGPVALPPVPWTKKQLKCRHFSSDTELIAAAEIWLDAQHSEFYFEWLANVRATG